jgi:hypothetical protein
MDQDMSTWWAGPLGILWAKKSMGLDTTSREHMGSSDIRPKNSTLAPRNPASERHQISQRISFMSHRQCARRQFYCGFGRAFEPQNLGRSYGRLLLHGLNRPGTVVLGTSHYQHIDGSLWIQPQVDQLPVHSSQLCFRRPQQSAATQSSGRRLLA